MTTVKELLDALGFTGPDHDENVRAALRELAERRRSVHRALEYIRPEQR